MSDIFGDFEKDFQEADKATPASGPGRVPPAVYKVVCATVDLKDDGKLVDHDAFEAKTGSKGFKLFFEILEPEKVRNDKTGEDEPTKGRIVEHVFWVTKDNLPYVKRDISTILGRDLSGLTELTKIAWAGKTCEIGVRDDTYQGFVKSKVTFINEWKPGEEVKPTDPASRASEKKPGSKAPAGAPSSPNVDF